MVGTCRLPLTQAVPAISLHTIKHLKPQQKPVINRTSFLVSSQRNRAKYYMPNAFKSMGNEP